MSRIGTGCTETWRRRICVLGIGMNDRSGQFRGRQIPKPPSWFGNVIIQRVFGVPSLGVPIALILVASYPSQEPLWYWAMWILFAAAGATLVIRVALLDVSVRQDVVIVRNIWRTYRLPYESIARAAWPRDLATHRLRLELTDGSSITPWATRTGGLVDGGLDAAYHITCRLCVLRGQPWPPSPVAMVVQEAENARLRKLPPPPISGPSTP